MLDIIYLLNLQVRDGNTSTSPTVGLFCGDSLPEPIYSSGSSMWIKFYSDYIVTRSGFLGYFQMIELDGMFVVEAHIYLY